MAGEGVVVGLWDETKWRFGDKKTKILLNFGKGPGDFQRMSVTRASLSGTGPEDDSTGRNHE